MKGKKLIGICGIVMTVLLLIIVGGAFLSKRDGYVGYLISACIICGILLLAGIAFAFIRMIIGD